LAFCYLEPGQSQYWAVTNGPAWPGPNGLGLAWLTALSRAGHITSYGPFNALLNELFPASEYYQVAPQFERIAGSIDFTVIYLITRRKVPILFIEVKPYVAYDSDSSRKAADDQMRERILDSDFTAGSIHIPKLYGISALGTRFCVYEYTPASRSLTPLRIAPHPHPVTDTAPKERWDLDFLEPQGEARLKEVVRHIKEMVVDLHNN
jgi:hypothetical protein